MKQVIHRKTNWNKLGAFATVIAIIVSVILFIIQTSSSKEKDKSKEQAIINNKSDSLTIKKQINVGTIKDVHNSGIQIGDSNKMTNNY